MRYQDELCKQANVNICELSKTRKISLWIGGGGIFLILFMLLRPYVSPQFLHPYILDNKGVIYALCIYLLASICWVKRGIFRRRNLLRMSILLCSILLSFAFLELTVRKLSPTPMFLPLLPTIPNVREVRGKIPLRGISSYSRHSTNEWGLRGDPIPLNWAQTFTILTIGGSTTHCLYLDDKKTWPHLLQEHLKTERKSLWVGNAGFDGHSTRGHLTVMDAIVKKVRPSALIFLVGINDLALSLDEKAKSGYYDNMRVTPQKWEHPWDRLRTFHLARQWKQVIFDEVAVGGVFHSNGNHTVATPEEFTPLPEDLRQMLPSLEKFKTNIGTLIKNGRELGCQILFMTQPMLFDDSERWENIVGQTFFIRQGGLKISAATYWRMLSFFNQSLVKCCAELDIPCYDLSNSIPHDEEYFYDPVHFTEAGATLVAKCTAEQVLRHFRF